MTVGIIRARQRGEIATPFPLLGGQPTRHRGQVTVVFCGLGGYERRQIMRDAMQLAKPRGQPDNIIGWVAMAIAVVALFENKSWRYILVNAGYNVVAFVLMGLIIGAWR